MHAIFLTNNSLVLQNITTTLTGLPVNQKSKFVTLHKFYQQSLRTNT